jgi:hypothetical protein
MGKSATLASEPPNFGRQPDEMTARERLDKVLASLRGSSGSNRLARGAKGRSPDSSIPGPHSCSGQRIDPSPGRKPGNSCAIARIPGTALTVRARILIRTARREVHSTSSASGCGPFVPHASTNRLKEAGPEAFRAPGSNTRAQRCSQSSEPAESSTGSPPRT